MGRKINPIGFRLSFKRDWRSVWYASNRNFKELVLRDIAIRNFINKQHANSGITKIEVAGVNRKVKVTIHTTRPGVVIGKKGEGIEKLRLQLRDLVSTNDISVDIKEIRTPELDAQHLASSIASQLERRTAFRRAMNRAITSGMRAGLEGIKVKIAGRLNGAEIARVETKYEGRLSLHTLRSNIEYGFAEARTSMGVIGVKVWVSHGMSSTQKKQVRYSLDLDEDDSDNLVNKQSNSEKNSDNPVPTEAGAASAPIDTTATASTEKKEDKVAVLNGDSDNSREEADGQAVSAVDVKAAVAVE